LGCKALLFGVGSFVWTCLFEYSLRCGFFTIRFDLLSDFLIVAFCGFGKVVSDFGKVLDMDWFDFKVFAKAQTFIKNQFYRSNSPDRMEILRAFGRCVDCPQIEMRAGMTLINLRLPSASN
jgi:hypothetical protein